MSALLQATGICKNYDTVAAVFDFDLAVARNETLGLIGPNGSGKTTLLRMLATIAKPDEGELRVCGLDALAEPNKVRQHISFMPAEYGTPQDMTIAEYLNYFACAAGVRRRHRRQTVADVLELTDLLGREDVIVRGLSTGNRQRLLLAKTLLGDPDILLLDEPASGLDPRARAEVRALLRELASMGKTIVISSHILADLEDICSSICIIEKGEKVSGGSLEDLRERHAAPHRVVHVRVSPADVERAVRSLGDLPKVMRCEEEEPGVLAVATTEENCNFILRRLIDGEIEILEMHEERPDLEEIFLKSTRGVVS